MEIIVAAIDYVDKKCMTNNQTEEYVGSLPMGSIFPVNTTCNSKLYTYELHGPCFRTMFVLCPVSQKKGNQVYATVDVEETNAFGAE